MPVLLAEYNNKIITDFEGAELFLLSHNDYLSYMIKDSRDGGLMIKEFKRSESEEFLDFHKNVLTVDPLLVSHFKQIYIGVANKRLVLVPENLFDHAQSRMYLENNVPVWQSDHIIVNSLQQQHIKLVYAFRKSLMSLYEDVFPKAIMHNALTQYVKKVDEVTALMHSGQNVFINVLFESFYIVLYNGNELIYANVYNFETKEDFLYYVMLIFKEFKLMQESTPIYISGKLDVDSAIHDLLMQYFRQLYFISRLGVKTSPIEGCPEHIYVDLFSLDL